MDEVQEYVENIDVKWQEAYQKVAKIIAENIPKEFVLQMQYGMPTYVVPLSVFPTGYLGREDEPLPFISLAAQKRHLSLYHMGIMGNKALLTWFQDEYKKTIPTKLNMGKSCIRFTNPKNIPYALIGELVTKMSMEDWVAIYTRFAEKDKQ
ncbi:hypothetical protein UAY_01067 [Enterococcus moraviensis ATCC BAA-383]|uniref:YdhG-like domain-containing protein n=1 Tax=Enterococcus moraviensis ATCC BAA-383 TaxID=1158609 RepID=R2T9C3_9ENTE|nr:DUF1801 domain-containing protein [Enterococcus moraviensis]EOI01659.1 hypothetical protein UAY_01067 [Enterococcus moraviensis ATCC BAA-383]EOT73806.1 hypothetical protein I586_00800 [Enterococcus moraviensis ATCC BAA-383]OJG65126.1 hypothetical protein RV09_GL001287 [Enterococcus moraviensis]